MLEELERREIPGSAVVILRRDQVVHARAYGIAELQSGRAVTEETIFQLGSISKQFTAAAILRLQEQGRLRISDPVSRYIPETPATWSGVTLEQLLRQTSGIREYFTIEEWQRLSAELERPASELIELILREPLTFEPGSRWSYSNSNYILLGDIIERVTSLSYEEYIDREFLRRHSIVVRHCPTLPSSAREAHGYQKQDGQLLPTLPENMNWIRGDGGLCTTAIDLARWAAYLQSGRLISPESLTLMNTPTRLNDGSRVDYGMAVSLVSLDGTRKIAHGGGMPGFTSMLATYPATQTTVAVVTNRGRVAADAIEKRVARELLGIDPPAISLVRPTEDEMNRYVGTFDIGVFAIRITKRDDGRLWLEVPPPGPTDALLVRTDGVLVAENEPDAYQVKFVSGDELVLLMAGMHWYGARIAPSPTQLGDATTAGQ